MTGRDRFSRSEADEIRRLLKLVRRAERSAQKVLRGKLRALGFYISDFAGGPAGFAVSDFDDLVRSGRIKITDEVGPGSGGERYTSATVSPRPSRARAGASSRTGPRAGAVGTAGAMRALAAEPLTFDAAVTGGVPDRPGLYALYGTAATWRRLGLGSPPNRRPLYIGKAEASLVSRDLNTHFATGRTGQSSPRRSFAALLSAAGALDLVAIPRRPSNPEPGKFTHYALEETGDEQLTEWMRSNLRIAVWPAPQGTVLRTVEAAVIGQWLPPLNLTGVKTQWTTQVKAARAVMAEQARAWARKRGLDV
jgi:hypothetical protein